MTVDGFGFGTLTGESCLKNVHCHTDRDSNRFWSPHVAKVCTVTQFRLGEGGWGGGGIPLGGGGRGRTENRDHTWGLIGALESVKTLVHELLA